MTDQELIRALASYGLSNGTTLGRHIGLMDVAADRLTAALEDLERVAQERDAAVEDLSECDNACEFCKYLAPEGDEECCYPPRPCTYYGAWQWRGPKDR